MDPITTSRGRFVVIVGPDGVGKTTVARGLIEQWSEATGYIHFRPPLHGGLVSHPSQLPDAPMPKICAPGFPPAGWLRLIRNLGLFWIGYLRTVRPLVDRGGLVVADRWGFGYVAQPTSLRFAGPQWLGRLGVRCLPQPDITINLTASPAAVHARKAELSIDEIRVELERWSRLPVRRLVTVDAQPPAGDVVAKVLNIVRAPGSI